MPGAAVTVGRGSLGEPPLPPTAPVPPVLLDDPPPEPAVDPPPEPAVALPPPPPCPPLPAAAASTEGLGSLGEHDTATVSAANDATIARIFMEVRAVAVGAVSLTTA
ncbi:hypothetical protein BE21_30745 [Sorangium cellulosum]|uniref:Uncharacterized protein n=1 Tax=Sorangium cellulosum TaxID=56 RepID=A0A150TR52_SORCE|nr:hypothetical protein BE21_30745 [Sorangium cellulosum]